MIKMQTITLKLADGRSGQFTGPALIFDLKDAYQAVNVSFTQPFDDPGIVMLHAVGHDEKETQQLEKARDFIIESVSILASRFLTNTPVNDESVKRCLVALNASLELLSSTLDKPADRPVQERN